MGGGEGGHGDEGGGDGAGGVMLVWLVVKEGGVLTRWLLVGGCRGWGE